MKLVHVARATAGVYNATDTRIGEKHVMNYEQKNVDYSF